MRSSGVVPTEPEAKRDSGLKTPDFEQAVAYALDLLAARLAPDLTYHNLWHTQADVMPAVERLAKVHGVSAADRQLLRVAAAYHDTGFTVQYEEHERAGVGIMRRSLPQFGFDEAQIAYIAELIMATRLPQSPRDLLGAILADADLDVLGRDDFFVRSEALRRETAVYRELISPEVWREQQLDFLEAHHYFTPAARAQRQPGKEAHMQLLRSWIAR